MAEQNGMQRLADGGDLFSNELKLKLHNVGKVASMTAATSAAAWLLPSRVLAGDAWPLYWRYNLSRVLDLAGLGDSRMLAIAKHTPASFIREFGAAYHHEFLLTMPLSLACAAAAGVVTARWLVKKFQSYAVKTEDEYIRGTKMLTPAEIDAAVAADINGPGKITLAGVRLPKTALNQNLMCMGAQGSGKSQAIESILDQLDALPAEESPAWICWSSARSEVATYYREGKDILLNPYDARSIQGWSIMNEIRPDFVDEDCESMASYLAPARGLRGNEKFFVEAASLVIADVMKQNYRAGKLRNTDLVDKLLMMSPDELVQYLRGRAGANMLKGDGMGASVQGTITSVMAKLRYMPDGEFSVRRFVLEGGDRRLFLHVQEDNIATFRPIAAAAISIAMRAAMLREKSPTVLKVLFLLDEVDSAGVLPELQATVTQARKYGVGVLLGCQSWSQIKVNYGEGDAAAILNGFQTKVLLRVTDYETQKTMSQLIGEIEWKAKSSNTSWGPADNKDGKSQSEQVQKREAVLPSEIGALPNLEGFLIIVGVGLTTLKIPYVSRKARAAEWVARQFEKRLPGQAPATSSDAGNSASTGAGSVEREADRSATAALQSASEAPAVDQGGRAEPVPLTVKLTDLGY